jgi:hypothetical protein
MDVNGFYSARSSIDALSGNRVQLPEVHKINSTFRDIRQWRVCADRGSAVAERSCKCELLLHSHSAVLAI